MRSQPTAVVFVSAVALLAACDRPPPKATADPTTASSAQPSSIPASTSAPNPSTDAAPSVSASASSNAPDVDAPLVDVKGNEVSVSSSQWTNGARYDVPAKPGNDVTLQLVEYVAAPGEAWKVVRADPALGKAKEKMVAGFWGPPTIGHLFTWSTKGVAPGAYEIAVTLAGASDPMTITFVVRVK